VLRYDIYVASQHIMRSEVSDGDICGGAISGAISGAEWCRVVPSGSVYNDHYCEQYNVFYNHRRHLTRGDDTRKVVGSIR
jgi:hypothetical protein